MKGLKVIGICVILFTSYFPTFSEDGHDLWLRYEYILDDNVRSEYSDQFQSVSVLGEGQTYDLIKEELDIGLSGLLGKKNKSNDVGKNRLLVGTADSDSFIKKQIKSNEYEVLEAEGYILKTVTTKGAKTTIITSKTAIGMYYGTFHLLRLMQNQEDVSNLDVNESPAHDIRILNHWDNLDRTSERGYAGFAIWDWHKLPDYIDPIYKEYARANASIGINGTVPINVNSNALVLTPTYLEKVKALADVLRPYGIKMYLTARFSAPMEIGGLETADPLNEEVIKWWNEKTKEIYDYVPDFGGYLVKANSEGQPGPNEYGRDHAQGANMLARALKPFGGAVMWRAFVYSEEDPDDRHKQAHTQFVPMDGTFDDNVMVQVKNGAIDFQPREPFHPMFGAMPKTPIMMEFQITLEYLGQGTSLVYMAPYFKECLDADTYANGEGSTVLKVVDGSLHKNSITGMAGVANTGTDRNWTGHLFLQSNWYAYGRLAWNPNLSSEDIADEWIGMTFGSDEEVQNSVKSIMMESREAVVNYMTPLGLHHLMATGHHYGPGPWVSNLGRPEWNPVYYHRADSIGIGFDRTSTGTNAVGQYFQPVIDVYGDPDKCPEEFLLWFHHVTWDKKMKSGKTLWNELCSKYQEGLDSVRSFGKQWNALQGKVDDERFEHVQMLLKVQEKEAKWWKDASLLYFQTISKRPFPANVEKPEKTLEYYQSIRHPFAPGRG